VTPEDGAPRPLPPRPPRSPFVHWAIDTAVVFLAMVLPALFLSVPIWAVLIAAAVVGWFLMPVTRRAELRGLAAREAQWRGDEPPAPG